MEKYNYKCNASFWKNRNFIYWNTYREITDKFCKIRDEWNFWASDMNKRTWVICSRDENWGYTERVATVSYNWKVYDLQWQEIKV